MKDLHLQGRSCKEKCDENITEELRRIPVQETGKWFEGKEQNKGSKHLLMCKQGFWKGVGLQCEELWL